MMKVVFYIFLLVTIASLAEGISNNLRLSNIEVHNLRSNAEVKNVVLGGNEHLPNASTFAGFLQPQFKKATGWGGWRSSGWNGGWNNGWKTVRVVKVVPSYSSGWYRSNPSKSSSAWNSGWKSGWW